MGKTIICDCFCVLLITALIILPLPSDHASAADPKESASQLDGPDEGEQITEMDSAPGDEDKTKVTSEEGAVEKSGNEMWLYGGIGVAALAAGVGLAAGGGGGGESSTGSGGDFLKNTTWNERATSFSPSQCQDDWQDDTVTFRADYTVVRTYNQNASGWGGPWQLSGGTLSYTPFSVTGGLGSKDYIGRCSVSADSTQYNCRMTWPGCSMQYRLIKR